MESSESNGLLRAIKRALKWALLVVVGLFVLAVAGRFGHALYSDNQAQNALTQRTAASDWQWLKEESVGSRYSTNVQWRITEDGDYVMRRVYEDHIVIAQLSKGEDAKVRLNAQADWFADCKEGTSIETSVVASDGNNFKLICVSGSWGSYLRTGVSWSDVDLGNLPTWDRNFDGFTVSEKFGASWGAWDFQPALRHLTLQSAKLPAEQTEENSKSPPSN